MELIVLKSEFLKAITEASRFVSTRSQLPVLNNIVLRAHGVSLGIEATNLEMSISTKVGANIKNEGEIAVPARTLCELVGSLDAETLQFLTEGEVLKITTSGFSGRIAGVNVSDFPEVLGELPEGSVSIPSGDLSQIIKLLAFSVSTDSTRVVLTGLLIQNNKVGTTFVTTDGFRLSKFEKEKINLGAFPQIIVPKTILSEVLKISAHSEEVRFSYSEAQNQVIFGIGNYTLASRVIDGAFPDYKRIIPDSSSTEIVVSRRELMSAVKTASVFARESANSVSFVAAGDTLKIASESIQGKQEIVVDGRVRGEDLEILFNYRFIEDFLGAAPGETIKIKLGTASSPSVFLDESVPSYLHLIMPVRG